MGINQIADRQQIEHLQSRFYEKPGSPTLIYLPGIHGDWTLFTSFRELAVKSFQVLEVTYPRTTDWTLKDYATAVEQELRKLRITRGWLLAESYGSQVAWKLMAQLDEREPSIQVAGIILAGGFVKYPRRLQIFLAEKIFAATPEFAWRFIFRIYAVYAKFRHRNAPETKGAIDEFIRRRTSDDLAAMHHRLKLIADSDPRPIAQNVHCPVLLLAGAIDPVVPAWPVLRWLKRNCPAFAGYRIVWPADHNVLGTEPKKSLAQIGEWIALHECYEC